MRRIAAILALVAITLAVLSSFTPWATGTMEQALVGLGGKALSMSRWMDLFEWNCNVGWDRDPGLDLTFIPWVAGFFLLRSFWRYVAYLERRRFQVD